MQESELQMIADHMGHSINIHTHVYRLQQHSIEKSKVARILLAADEGTLHRMKAQTDLDHLNLSELPIPDEAGRTFTIFKSFVEIILTIGTQKLFAAYFVRRTCSHC